MEGEVDAQSQSTQSTKKLACKQFNEFLLAAGFKPMPGSKSEAERDGADGAEKKFVSREEVCTVKMMRDQAQYVYSKVDLSTGKP
jgi:hypothetical protein